MLYELGGLLPRPKCHVNTMAGLLVVEIIAVFLTLYKGGHNIFYALVHKASCV